MEKNDRDYFSGKIKVGSDGTTGMSAYKMSSNEAKATVDAYLTCICPLTLKAHTKSGKTIVLWKNPRPCSANFTRPFKFKMVKETALVILLKK